MSRGIFKIVFIALSVFAFGGGLTVDNEAVNPKKEDELIVRALLAENYGDYHASMSFFLRLYDITGNVEYLIQAARESLIGKNGEDEMIAKISRWIPTAKDSARKRIAARMLAALYVKKRDLHSAERVCDSYLGNSDNPVDLKLTSSVKIDLKKYAEAVDLLKRAYAVDKDEKTLLREALLFDKYIGDTTAAVKLLEEYIDKTPKATVAAYFKLIEIYAREKKLHKVLDLYKKLYIRDKQEYFLNKIVKLSAYLKDLRGLVAFIEKYGDRNSRLLYDLYKELDMYDKAIAFSRHMYETERNPKWIAEEAIMLYEKALSGKNITPSVIKKMSELFEKALEKGVKDPLYLNYYGYILIDHDIDIDKGLRMVAKALIDEPKNAYFMDSMAWGLYKKGACEKAYGLMKKVVGVEGLKVPEIRTHWDSIKRCITIKDFGHREIR